MPSTLSAYPCRSGRPLVRICGVRWPPLTDTRWRVGGLVGHELLTAALLQHRAVGPARHPARDRGETGGPPDGGRVRLRRSAADRERARRRGPSRARSPHGRSTVVARPWCRPPSGPALAHRATRHPTTNARRRTRAPHDHPHSKGEVPHVRAPRMSRGYALHGSGYPPYAAYEADESAGEVSTAAVHRPPAPSPPSRRGIIEARLGP